MQGRKCFALVISLFIFAACSGGARKPDCFDCTEKNQSWNKFAWKELVGTWRGSMESVSDGSGMKKSRDERSVEISFVHGTDFLKSYGVRDCGAFPAESVVVKGVLWMDANAAKRNKADYTYEVFGKTDGDGVSYGRAVLEKVNGDLICKYQKVEHALTMNRLGLPAAEFTVRETPNGRVLASGSTPESQMSVEFLNYSPKKAVVTEIAKGGRAPASLTVKENPPLFLRVFRITNDVRSPYDRGEWKSTQEYLYRLWKTN